MFRSLRARLKTIPILARGAAMVRAVRYRHDLHAIDHLLAFSPFSAGSPAVIARLAYRSATSTFPLLGALVARIKGVDRLPEPIALDRFCQPNEFTNELSGLFDRYGSDKSTAHNYPVIYSHILRDRAGVKRMLEIGMGSPDLDIASNMGPGGNPGASLRAFRDFLPHAMVFGADIDDKIMFEEERIKTFVVDQTDPASLDRLGQFTGPDLDLVIDDGLHSPDANLAVAAFALQALRVGGWLVIEDIRKEAVPVWQIVLELIGNRHEAHLVSTQASFVLIVRKR